MFGYHKTNGDRGEICVERSGNFIGFIVNQGRVDRWAAYDRRLSAIGEGYGSRAQAATACWHQCRSEKKIPIAEILVLTPSN
jgi:hypothetical protein